MKKTLFLALVIAFPAFANSQNCLPDGIIFNTQSQIDNFPANYPECDSIIGQIAILGDYITNLDSLIQIRFIGGGLHINQCSQLSSIKGLKNLKGIGRTLAIIYCNSLKSFEGLGEIEYIGNDFLLWDNYFIQDLSQLSNLKVVEGNLVIHFMDGLKSLKGLENLKRINNELVIWKNDSLANIQSLMHLDTIRNGITIMRCPRIKDLNGLSNTNMLRGRLTIRMNDSLSDIYALHNLNPNALDSVIIRNNPMLSECSINSICELLEIQPEIVYVENNASLCNSIEEIEINCNDQGCLGEDFIFTTQLQIDSFPINYPNCSVIEGDLTISGGEILNLEGLSQIRKVNGRFSVLNCSELLNLNGLERLHEIGKELYLLQNNSLINIDAFAGLFRVGKDIKIDSNISLQNVNGFIGLRLVSKLEISSNLNLSNISGLSNLRKIDGDFSFILNPKVINFNEISNLQEISGGLTINACESLNSMNGFENIEKLPNGLLISSCDSLLDLSGLQNLNKVDKFCIIRDCKYLSKFEGLESLNYVDSLQLINLSSIKNFEGLNSILTINGILDVSWNDSLESFQGLENIESLNGGLTVMHNRQLRSFDKLIGLKSIADGIYIMGNDLINNVKGLNNVVEFKGQIGIIENSNLQSLEGLENIFTDSITRFEITENPKLYLCHVPSICEFIENIPDDIYINVSDNLNGCNNIEEIMEWCFISSENLHPFPLIEQNPVWRVLDKEKNEIETFQTHKLEFLADTIICDYYYSKITIGEKTVFLRQDNLKYVYRIGNDCSSKEYLLYDFGLDWGDETYLGWGQHMFIQKDTASFVVSAIDYIQQFGVSRKRISLTYSEPDNSYTGELEWVEGIGSLEHPFYPFALMDNELKHEYELLCLDSLGTQIYQNPNYNTCDTNYNAINELIIEDWKIKPNPFHKYISISNENIEILDIHLFTITGQEIPLDWPRNAQTTLIRVLEEASYGFCLLQIITEQGSQNIKLLRLRDFTY
jgi:hypothetical protein